MLALDDVTVTADRGDGTEKKILSNVSFEVAGQQSVGLVGETGSGKSVLVAAIAGLIRPPLHTRGRISFEGSDLLTMDPEPRRRILGERLAILLPGGRSRLNPLESVARQIARVILDHNDGVSRSEAEDRAIALLTRVGIPDARRRGKSYPHELSGGMAQRVLIAMVLANRPRFIVADEPTTGLDVTVQRQVLEDLANLLQDEGLGILIATRDLGIVAHYCERVIVLGAGNLVEDCNVYEFFSNPKDAYSKRLLQATLLERRVAEPI